MLINDDPIVHKYLLISISHIFRIIHISCIAVQTNSITPLFGRYK